MTSNLDVVKAWTDLPAGDLAASAAYLSEDFQSLDKDGNVEMNKEVWVGMGHILLASFTDYDWVRTGIREEGDFVILSGRFEGSFTSDLDLSAMGIGVIPASGKEIDWQETSSKITVEGDKIVRMEQIGDLNGMETFLAALGVEPPAK